MRSNQEDSSFPKRFDELGFTKFSVKNVYYNFLIPFVPFSPTAVSHESASQ